MVLKFIRFTVLPLAFLASVALPFIYAHRSAASRTPERITLPTLRQIAIQSSLSRNTKSRSPISQPAVITWKGSQNNLWSNPRNWDVGRLPGPTDVARFSRASSSEVRVDANSPGVVGGLILDSDYRGTISLKQNLTVTCELLLAGGTFRQGDYSLSVTEYRQTGGAFEGGGAVLSVKDIAAVTGGTLLTSKWMTAESLAIDSPAVVTMSRNSKLNLTGEGEPLKGNGLLDISKYGSASVEYTGRATADVTAASPIRGALGVADITLREQLSKVTDLGSPRSNVQALTGFSRAGALTLTAKEDFPFAAVIDTLNGFAYFGTLTTPGIIVKVRLSDFTRVGALVLNSGQNDLRCAVIDAVNGFAYFGSLSGHIVKVRLSDFTHVGSFEVGGPLATAVIDTANGFAYFGAFTGPGAIVKVRLSDFVPVDVLILNDGEDGLLCAVIDTSNGFAYFGTDNSPGVVVKIRLSDFTRVVGLTLNLGEDELTCAVIDPANGFAYFGTFTLFFHIVKVRLSDLTRVDGLFENNGEAPMRSAVIDTANGFAYFATDDEPGLVIKIRLSDFKRVGTLRMSTQLVSELFCAVIDPVNGFAYFGHGIHAGAVKVRLSDFTEVGNVAFSRGENNLGCAVIDSANGFAYFGTDANPGLVIKVRLSDFTRVGILALDDTPEASNEIFLRSAVIDTANGFAYFGTDRSPGAVVKVRLSDFTRVGKITLNTGEGALFAAVIDTANGFAYFSSVDSPFRGIIVKIRLSDFTRVGSLTLNDGERGFCAVIDPANGFAYFGGPNSSGVVKVKLSDFSRVGALPLSVSALSAVIDTANGFGYFAGFSNRIMRVRLSDFTSAGDLLTNSEESNFQSAVIDPTNGFAYFGTLTSPARVVRVRLSDFTRVDAVTLDPGEDFLTAGVIDIPNASAYFGTGTLPGRIVKINLADAGPTPSPSPSPTSTPSPTPTTGPPQLLLDESGPAPNQAAALDSVLFLRDPFPVVNPVNLLNPGPDRNTRVIVFVSNLVLLQGEPSSGVVVNLVDGSMQSYDIPAEDVRPVPNFGFVQVIFRLPDNLAIGLCSISIKAHGEVSNVGLIRIRV